MLKNTLQALGLIAVCSLLFVILPGCPKTEEGCGGLVEGQVYEVELQILDGDILYAVEAEQEGEHDDDCEQEDEHEGENQDCDGEHDEDDDEDDDESEVITSPQSGELDGCEPPQGRPIESCG